MADIEKHPTNIPGFETLEDAAEYIGNMRYDALRDLVGFLDAKVTRDSTADHARGRFMLSANLLDVTYYLSRARVSLDHVWSISKRHMDINDD